MNSTQHPFRLLLPGVLCMLSLAAHAQPSTEAPVPVQGTSLRAAEVAGKGTHFVSRGDGVLLLLQSVAAQMKLPVVVSSKAQKRRVEGHFDLAQPTRVLEQLSRDLGLVWYSDGQTLYVTDASETRSAVGSLQFASVAVLNDFLRRTRLHDARYAVRGGNADGTFYVAGPPVYVDIVINAARYLDELYRNADQRTEHVEVIPLRNSFVQGRRYGLRGQETTLPGVAETLSQLLGGAGITDIQVQTHQPGEASVDPSSDAAAATRRDRTAAIVPPAHGASPSAPVTVVMPYPETNSVLVRGTLVGIQKVKQLVAELDLPRRQVELSLWIIDMRRQQLDELGVKWTGEVGIAGRLGVSFNGNSATLDGQRFLASVSALSTQGLASIVSRPVLLTQENVLAHFDSNSSFYARLEAERATSLETVTYGTLVSVLPRVSDHDEVEMQLRIEDGNTTDATVAGLPVVARTSIDTVARVPHTLSLLVGGYTRQEQARDGQAVPGLGEVPLLKHLFRHRSARNHEMVRVFLIQPRVLGHAAAGLDFDALQETPSALPALYQSVRDDVLEATHGKH